MSNNIGQCNEKIIKGQIKELVRGRKEGCRVFTRQTHELINRELSMNRLL